MKLDTRKQVAQAESVLSLVWLIVFGAVLFSVLTVTPLVQRVTPDAWDWTAWLLPVVVDAAVVIVVRVDSIVARLDGRPGGWPALLRWLTGAMTLLLNVGDSMLKRDWVGVGVHAVAPILLIVTAEAALGWRRAITAAVARIERERSAERERQEREQRAAEERSRQERQDREAAERAERERQEKRQEERERLAAVERERDREHAARLAQEAREHEAQTEREREARADARAAAARDAAERERREKQEAADRRRREEQAKADREKAATEAAKHAERERKAAEARRSAEPVSTPRPAVSALVSTAAHGSDVPLKMPEAQALTAVADGIRRGDSQRQIAALTGWSAGWVAKQCQALTDREEDAA